MNIYDATLHEMIYIHSLVSYLINFGLFKQNSIVQSRQICWKFDELWGDNRFLNMKEHLNCFKLGLHLRKHSNIIIIT